MVLIAPFERGVWQSLHDRFGKTATALFEFSSRKSVSFRERSKFTIPSYPLREALTVVVLITTRSYSSAEMSSPFIRQQLPQGSCVILEGIWKPSGHPRCNGSFLLVRLQANLFCKRPKGYVQRAYSGIKVDGCWCRWGIFSHFISLMACIAESWTNKPCDFISTLVSMYDSRDVRFF